MASLLLRQFATPRYCFSADNNQIKLVIVRHGESIWNKHKKWAGWTDVRLSSTGKKQAKECGSLLRNKGFLFDVAYCSRLTRSVQTLNYILDEMGMHYIPVHKEWRLNEKHYGCLTGENKVEIIEKYGAEKVAQWRRSFQIRPPSVDKYDQRHPSKDSRYLDIESEHLPTSENQQDVIDRVNILWKEKMVPEIIARKNLIISAHGSSVRALVKIISNYTDEEIMKFHVPHAVPLVYTLKLTADNKIQTQKLEYLGDEQDIILKMSKVENQTKKAQY